MSKYIARVNFAVLTLLILALSPQAHALQNCSDLLQDHINWAAQPDSNNKYYFVGLTKTSNLNNRKFASYTVVRILDHENGALVGKGRTWFSDRKTCEYTKIPFSNPFCGKTDDIKVTLRKHGDPLKINIHLDLLTWGTQENLVAQCDNGHIYDFKTDHHGTHLIDITLSKEKVSGDPTK